jgi:DNA-binding GntR family transcriptional regulator
VEGTKQADQSGSADAAESPYPPLRFDVSGPRGLALSVHQELRQLILEGSVEPGMVLNQAELARAFGVSRTPMREAFRMLQEEGLIHAEPDRRAVVIGLDLADLDAMYGARLVLEALAVRMTVPVTSPEALAALEDALTQMHELRAERQTSAAWNQAHDEFHRLATAGATVQVLRLLGTLRERTHRYLLLAQTSDTVSWETAQRRHQAILDAFKRKDAETASAAMAEHLASTAFRVVTSADPGRDLPTVESAVAMLGLPGTH